MPLDPDHIRSLARHLDDARLQRREVPRLTEQVPDLSTHDAYAIQLAGLDLRLARGEVVVGWKMGLTSAAKRAQMNIHQPVFGPLTDVMRVQGEFAVAAGIHPKAEPEVAFRTRAPLQGQISRDEAWSAVGEVCAALEILDSRYVGFKYFSLPDVIADNCSSSHYVLGPWRPAAAGDVRDLPVELAADGQVVQTASTSDISGDPVLSLVQLVALLAERGQGLPAGSLVLAGAATPAEALRPALRVEARIPSLPAAQLLAK